MGLAWPHLISESSPIISQREAKGHTLAKMIWLDTANILELCQTHLDNNLRGRGSEADFHFFLFLIEEDGSYQKLFWNGKILFLAKVIEFLIRENTYNYIASANFNRVSPIINLSSPTVSKNSWRPPFRPFNF